MSDVLILGTREQGHPSDTATALGAGNLDSIALFKDHPAAIITVWFIREHIIHTEPVV